MCLESELSVGTGGTCRQMSSPAFEQGTSLANWNIAQLLPSRMSRAKQLAEVIVASMQAQGYLNIEYILTERQLKIVASKTDGTPQTAYVMLPSSTVH